MRPVRALPLEVSLLLSRRPACRLVLGRLDLHPLPEPADGGSHGETTIAMLRHFLRAELRDIRFWRPGDAQPEIVWLCAFAQGSERLVERLRADHPQAFLLVSARNPGAYLTQSLKALGADAVYGIRDLQGLRLREILRAGLAHKRGVQPA